MDKTIKTIYKPQHLVSLYENAAHTQKICAALAVASASGQNTRLNLSHIAGSLKTITIAAVHKQQPATQLFVLQNAEQAAYFYNDLQQFLPQEPVYYLPHSAKEYYNTQAQNNANILLRSEILIQAQNQNILIVTYPEAIFEKVVTQQSIAKNTLHIVVGENLGVDFLLDVLVEYGFERVDFVSQPGEFSVRGGIIDVFSFANDLPYRLELLGDEVESIRSFDLETQLSVQRITQITLVPNLQIRLAKDPKQSLINYLVTAKIPQKNDHASALPAIKQNLNIWIDNLQLTSELVQIAFENAENDYAKNKKDLEILPEPSELFEQAKSFLFDVISQNLLVMGDVNNVILKSIPHIHFQSEPQVTVRKNFKFLMNQMQENERKGYKNFLFSESKSQIERLYRIFRDLGSKTDFFAVNAAMHQGFVDNNQKIAVFTDHQIFERYHSYKLKSQQLKSETLTLAAIKELKKGDFVTHIDHGVGIYDGLQKLVINNRTQEAVKILYKEGDTLFVNINSLHKITRFSGSQGNAPKLNRLGSDVWKNLKNKTKSQVKDIAKDLIKLYAQRKTQKGFAFMPDTYLQAALESSFIYEDTPDQRKATNAVKMDMERNVPMDRLVCGDVGFGKTEVAIRAAFKAVADGKQVAVLVPTTILALQHYKTFEKRLEDLPCTVDYLNRFKTAKAQKLLFENLENGKIDIVIGTHGLVGKNVKFKDLGLLVIDEEQKFGVAVKERLKQIRVNIDTLTLTATPIPRTLQFSLMGARDLSVMRTPPANRQPVHTELIAMTDERLRQIILDEVQRGGQVFFVHNRVMNINEIAEMIGKLCPNVTVGIAHGQMEGNKLEDSLLDFINGEFDVLVATNIIESGLDIPNANTIIINQAQNFGLSDLHQMRGRVGRSNVKAYCYLSVPPINSLSDDAQKRLQAIETFSDLGSGFNVALRDLDIRGAGNLLGGEQSGFITDIGFEMYQKILEEAILELKEDAEFTDLFADQPQRAFVKDCTIETDFEALFPDKYISNANERLNLYLELDNIETEAGLQRFETALKDRFGAPPAAALALIDIIRLRWVAKAMGFERLWLKNNTMKGYFVDGKNEKFYQSDVFGKVLAYIQANPKTTDFKQSGSKVILDIKNISSVDQAKTLLYTLLKPNE